METQIVLYCNNKCNEWVFVLNPTLTYDFRTEEKQYSGKCPACGQLLFAYTKLEGI